MSIVVVVVVVIVVVCDSDCCKLYAMMDVEITEIRRSPFDSRAKPIATKPRARRPRLALTLSYSPPRAPPHAWLPIPQSFPAPYVLTPPLLRVKLPPLFVSLRRAYSSPLHPATVPNTPLSMHSPQYLNLSPRVRRTTHQSHSAALQRLLRRKSHRIPPRRCRTRCATTWRTNQTTVRDARDLTPETPE
jgi:hypothetical protein